MTDELTPAASTPPTPPPTPPAAEQTTTDVPGSWEDVFKHPRFKELNQRAKEAEEKLAKITAAQKQAEEDNLKKRAEYKELYERTQQELETERLERLRLTVATTKGLPIDLAGRLRGTSQEELEADAEQLVQFLKPSEGPGVPPATGKGQANKFDLSKMTPEEIRKKTTGKAISEFLNP